MGSDEEALPEKEKLGSTTIGKLVEQGEARIVRVASDLLSLDYDYGRTFMFEIMRADVNGDGIQELIIYWGGGPLQGTYSTGDVLVLTRKSDRDLFEIAL